MPSQFAYFVALGHMCSCLHFLISAHFWHCSLDCSLESMQDIMIRMTLMMKLTCTATPLWSVPGMQVKRLPDMRVQHQGLRRRVLSQSVLGKKCAADEWEQTCVAIPA